MRRLHDPGAYGAAATAGNFWARTATAPRCSPLEGDRRAEVAVIGAGYTGLNAALHLAEAGLHAVVLEARQPGWGASGRNGGFCCLGGAGLDDGRIARRHGAAAADGFARAQRSAIDHVAGLLDRHGIDADTHSNGETMLAHGPRAAAGLADAAAAIAARHGVTPTQHTGAELAALGMSSPAFHGGLTVPLGFALNPMKYAAGLARAAVAAGAGVHGDSPVTAITRAGGNHVLHTPGGRLTTRRLIVATNGYSSEDIPPALAGRTLPVQSAVLVTRPLSGAEIAAQGWSSTQMCYDTRNLLHYFRLMPDRRFLFGMRGALRATPAALERARQATRADFEAVFPAWAQVETPHFWSGLVCFSARLTPFAGPLPGMENAWAALAYHGNGVAMGSLAGRMVADLARGADTDIPAPMRAPLARFALGRWRRALLRPAYAGLALADRIAAG